MEAHHGHGKRPGNKTLPLIYTDNTDQRGKTKGKNLPRICADIRQTYHGGAEDTEKTGFKTAITCVAL
jgi:hypothetical protein